MTRDEYECLQALRFELPISADWATWLRLINAGWLAKPAHLADLRLAMSEFIVTEAGEQALREFR